MQQQRVHPSVRDRVTTTQRMRQRNDDTQTDVAKATAAVQEALRMCTRASRPSIPRNDTQIDGNHRLRGASAEDES